MAKSCVGPSVQPPMDIWKWAHLPRRQRHRSGGGWHAAARTAKTLNFSDHSTGKAPGVTRSPVPIEHGLKRAN